MSDRALQIIEGVAATLLLATVAVLTILGYGNEDSQVFVVEPVHRTTVVHHYYW